MKPFKKLPAKFLSLFVALGATTFSSTCDSRAVAFVVSEISYLADVVAQDYLYYDDDYYYDDYDDCGGWGFDFGCW